MINPAKNGENMTSPVERANELNDPSFQLNTGYFNYDLTHQELSTPLFGQITPICHMDTVPADRIVISNDTKLIRNQINGNLLSNLNMYVDSFYIPLRSVYPTNYEKLIPNPVKGEDIVNSALPGVPLLAYIKQLYAAEKNVSFDGNETDELYKLMDIIKLAGEEKRITPETELSDILVNISFDRTSDVGFLLGRLALTATVLSRGQLLDYLGIQFDAPILTSRVSSALQKAIDDFFTALWTDFYNAFSSEDGELNFSLTSWELSLTTNEMTGSGRTWDITSLEDFRSYLSDVFERGEFPHLMFDFMHALPVYNLIHVLEQIFAYGMHDSLSDELDYVNGLVSLTENEGIFNIGKILAYQQVISHYYTNDRVDNIYSSELFMQNLRSIMYPTAEDSLTTVEPTFDMNGVRFEYDYISYGGFASSLLYDDLMSGCVNRQYVWATVMLLLKRSLRYGDYFATARPNMLAVSDQLAINVDGGQVSPIDITKNLLLQRYLNAANYISQGFMKFMSAIYGVKPSDTGCFPRFVSHRKIGVQNQITNNTGENQGAQTTNLVAYGEKQTMDVFIDDFGYLISLVSYDVLPVYKSGIDPTYHLFDRFDFFNPMMQGIGDQHIRSSELLGFPELYSDTFGYVVRNGEYKFKNSHAHGAFCNDLPGYLISYPLYAYNKDVDGYDINIDPDFIRDKPVYLDSVLPQSTGVSPAQYWHFILSSTNEVKCARKIQALPGILF